MTSTDFPKHERPAAVVAPSAVRGVPNRGAVTWRSVLLGLVGVAFVCGLTPYNDYVLKNTFFVGNFLPIGLLLFFLAFVMLVNAPLWRWAPRWGFSTGELAVALGMTLVSCALPSSGLMRYVPGHLVNYWPQAAANPDARQVLESLDLPDWMFPTFVAPSTDVLGRANEPVVTGFRSRITPGQDDTPEQWAKMWRAWWRPAVTWGPLLTGMFGMILCASVLVRRQWVENERLPFPLASVYLSLIETPEPGRGLNTLFRATGFWIAAAAVFVVHAFNALNKYDAKVWPAIPVNFDLGSLFSEAPLAYVDWGLKAQVVYFSIVGFAFFLQSKVGFSLWFFYVLASVAMMGYGTYGVDLTGGMQTDQMFGALLPFAAAILWVGRRHWAAVFRSMVGRARTDDPRGRYLPYGLAGWGLVACAALTAGWLVAVGMTVAGAVVLVGMTGLLWLVIARIVAETGLIFVQLPIPAVRPWVFALQDLPASMAVRTTPQNYFMSSVFFGIQGHDLRESLPPFVTNALRVADGAAYDDDAGGGRRAVVTRGAGFFLCLVLALAVGYVVSGWSMLRTEYAHGVTLDRSQESPLNPHGTKGSVDSVLNSAREFVPPNVGPKETHSRWGYFGFGFALTSALSVLRLRFAGWPLHPVGYLLCFTYPMDRIWFSVFLGWLVKTLLVRFGGSDLYRRARPVFIGLIIGEASAAACWLVVSVVMNQLGLPFHAINLMPT
ncbi:MAG TPA: DUF6785 family protein [Tepidisphaeraceae bacterium]|nr:DUF6785 family protein [Tepidisphaeraceae bacterium]